MLECPSVSYSPIHPAARVGRYPMGRQQLRFLCSCALARKYEPGVCIRGRGRVRYPVRHAMRVCLPCRQGISD